MGKTGFNLKLSIFKACLVARENMPDLFVVSEIFSIFFPLEKRYQVYIIIKFFWKILGSTTTLGVVGKLVYARNF